MNGKPWLKEHTSMLWELYATHHDHEIAERTGHDQFTVMRRRQALGLPAYYPTRYARLLDLPPASLAAIKRAARMEAA